MQYEFSIKHTLITVNLLKKKIVNNSHVKAFKVRESYFDNTHHGFEHMPFLAVIVLLETALPLSGVSDEVVNIGVSSLAVTHTIVLRRARLQRATVSEVGSRAKTRVVSSDELWKTRCATGTAKFFEFLPHVG